jgi:quercetin dioxygenase-like cupin family protein
MRIVPHFYDKSDKRGRLSGLLRTGIGEINRVVTKKGVVRGGHYHLKTTEYLIFITGKARAWAVSLEGRFLWDRIMNPGEVLMISPGQVHFIESLDECLWLNALDRAIEDRSPDIHKPAIKDLGRFNSNKKES